MTSPNKPKPKASRLTRMTEKPVWRRKSPRNKSIITNEVGSHSTPPTSYFPNFASNQQGHSFDPLYKPYNIGQPSSFKPNYTSQPPTSHNDPYMFDQPSNYNSNYTNPIHHINTMILSTLPQKNKSSVMKLTKSMILVISLLCILHNATKGNLDHHPMQIAFPTLSTWIKLQTTLTFGLVASSFKNKSST